MDRYQRMDDRPPGNWSISQQPEPKIVQGFQLLRQSVDLYVSVAQNRSESHKSSMKGASLISRTSELMSKDKAQGIFYKQDKITDDTVFIQKDELKKVQAKGEDYRNMDEHRIELNQLALRLHTSLVDGLREEEASAKNLQFGDNKLSDKKNTPWWIKLVKEMFQPFSCLLWVASILCIALFLSDPKAHDAQSNFYLALILVFIILLTGSITFQQTAKSEALMDSFKDFLPQECDIIRDGIKRRIPAEKLVPGDIVELKMGDKLPADVRIIYSRDMKVDNSALTGEADLLLRVVECTNADNPLESKNLAFLGTLCKEGSGRGIVIAIGDRTIMGQIADLVKGGEQTVSPLNLELKRFVIMISVIAVTMGVILFFLSLYLQGAPFDLAVSQGIGIIVANVPEGLLGCITISLSITAKILADKKVLVKNLEAVETLGSTSCICSDKTGTLTQNKMTVENVWYDNMKRRALNKQKHGKSVEYEYDQQDSTFRDLQDCTIVTSEARFNIQVKDKSNINWLETPTIGDASESALIKFFQPIEDIQQTRDRRTVINLPDGSQGKLPFNSTNKYSLCITDWETHDSHFCVYIKGAPEKLWTFCSYLLVEGRNKPIDVEATQNFKNVNLSFGKNGERVLGFAKFHLPRVEYPKNTIFNVNSQDSLNFKLEGFTFLGLISLIDPPKDNVPYAIEKCHAAGIKVIMVTGDQPPTAAAIARQIGIISGKTVDDLLEENPSMTYGEAFRTAPAIVVHGDMIVQALEEEQELEAQGQFTEDMRDQKLLSWCSKSQVVFARTSPAQKLMIVRAYQRLGHVCAVTGDGVNDSPAIKQGDIGISMGISGSDVTKDAADMILLNDDFSSIVDGIEEGRKIFDNLKKTIVYLLTSNITEIFPYIAQIGFGLPLPLSNIFILVICIGTDILPAISFAYEQAEIDIMTRQPRKRTDHLVSVKLITHAYLLQGQIATAAGFFSYFSTMNEYGFSPSILFSLRTQPYIAIPWASGDQPTRFDPTSPTLGSPVLPLDGKVEFQTGHLNWLSDEVIFYDLRYVFVQFDTNEGRWQPAFPEWNVQNPYCRYQDQVDSLLTVTPNINHSPCFKIAALKWAQTSYFAAIVLVQWSNVFACKQRKMSIIYSPVNTVMLCGVALETVILLFIVYVPGINTAFGARPVDILNLGTPGLPFSILLFCWDETRKFLIRNYKTSGKGVSNWFEIYSLW